jgi:hypothetical protein
VKRRQFIARAIVWVAGSLTAPLLGARAANAGKPLRTLLETSSFVYVSPLRSDGSESKCHAEVWYAWLDDAVVMIVASDRWKARAIERGLGKARIWVGDHGRLSGWISNDESFRKAPSFEARGEKLRDEALLDRLLTAYEQKYPSEIDQWRDRMRQGHADGSRVLVRYRPVPAL